MSQEQYERYKEHAESNLWNAGDPGANFHNQQILLATAQVYATLALAEATHEKSVLTVPAHLRASGPWVGPAELDSHADQGTRAGDGRPDDWGPAKWPQSG